MNDEILKKLEARLDRRGFLRGSGLAAAALIGMAAASPLVAFAQAQDKPQDEKKKDEPARKAEDTNGKAPESDEDPTKVTRLDEDGNEYRECPQCGRNMYRQGRTWSCENCGYSYIE
jgi:rubredoxin